MLIDVIIVGAGPGGLACAKASAAKGLRTLVLEKKLSVGKKVCAGGVTWNGLVNKIPESLFEKTFPRQHIFTRRQRALITSPTPIIATLNRIRLGKQMAKEATDAGAEIKLGCQVQTITGNQLIFLDKKNGKTEEIRFNYLVGADGSTSVVRKHLGLPATAMGIGINYQLPGNYPEMQWHLDSELFRSGYSWIFPHKETVSVGAYVDARVMKANHLKQNLLVWADRFDFPLSKYKPEAEYINFDYRGYMFNNIFLVGDAAGLASALTGEGIYPAIVSGTAVAEIIAYPQVESAAMKMQKLVKNHARHKKMVTLAGKSRYLSSVLSELVTFCLKKKLLDFSAAEMAH